MFRWGIANRFPTTCVAIARTAMAAIQSTWIDRSATRNNLNSATMPTFFEPAARNREIVVGAPWYTPGAHMWNGTTATLNPKPARRKTIPTMSGGSILGPIDASPTFNASRSVRWPIAAIDVDPATPYTIEIPKRMIAEDTAPMMKNFREPSLDYFFFFPH